MDVIKLRLPPHLPIDTALAVKAEHVDAFRTGNPFSMAKHAWDVELGYHGPRNVIYHDGRVAWFDQGHLPHVMNLELGHEMSYPNPTRERSILLCLSSDVLAVTTASGRCYAWTLWNPSAPSSIQLRSAQVKHLCASGMSIALVHREDIVSGQISITVWSLEHGTTKSFNVNLLANPHRSPETYVIHMAPDWLLLLEQDRGPPNQIFFSRYTLDGNIIAQGTSGNLHCIHLPVNMNVAVFPQQKILAIEEIYRGRKDKNGWKAPSLCSKMVKGIHGLITFAYDARNDQLHSRQHELCCTHTCTARGCRCRKFRYVWKDIAFGFCSTSEDRFHDDLHKSGAFDLRSQSVIEDYRGLLDYDMATRSDEGWPNYFMTSADDRPTGPRP
ncbi:MAG: hypothetical protein Q9224_001279, partial [Gallowayella concinna]